MTMRGKNTTRIDDKKENNTNLERPQKELLQAAKKIVEHEDNSGSNLGWSRETSKETA